MERNSAHELLRIFAMFQIVLYHLISYYLYLLPHNSAYDYILEATLPTFHIGVILFILITGYYGIKPSIKGLFHLLFIVLVYYLPIEIVNCIYNQEKLFNTLLFITNTPYWFIRTYFYLYLISPILNTYLRVAKQRDINIMLFFLGIIAVYFGMMQGDSSLKDGKNLVNFMFLYFLGWTIHHYQSVWENVRKYCWIVFFMILNCLTFIILLKFNRHSYIGQIMWQCSFLYCSPLLILNSILLFMFFSGLHFHSKVINYLGCSTFAVYIIHCQPTFHKYIIMPLITIISTNYFSYTQSSLNIVFMYIIFIGLTIGIMLMSIGIDKALTPLWKIEQRFCVWLENKING